MAKTSHWGSSTRQSQRRDKRVSSCADAVLVSLRDANPRLSKWPSHHPIIQPNGNILLTLRMALRTHLMTLHPLKYHPVLSRNYGPRQSINKFWKVPHLFTYPCLMNSENSIEAVWGTKTLWQRRSRYPNDITRRRRTVFLLWKAYWRRSRWGGKDMFAMWEKCLWTVWSSSVSAWRRFYCLFGMCTAWMTTMWVSVGIWDRSGRRQFSKGIGWILDRDIKFEVWNPNILYQYSHKS